MVRGLTVTVRWLGAARGCELRVSLDHGVSVVSSHCVCECVRDALSDVVGSA